MFSEELETELKAGRLKTVKDLQEVFDEKSFAILFLIFMFIPSLPIPTGGVTQFFLLPTVMIASLQMVFGRRSLWLPWFITRRKIPAALTKKGLPFMIKRIRWFEQYARPRLAKWFDKASFRTLTGLLVLLFALGSFISPPFSGLDTLPSMGAVIIALSLIFEDIVLYFMGIVVGAVGLGVIAAAANLVIAFFEKIF